MLEERFLSAHGVVPLSGRECAEARGAVIHLQTFDLAVLPLNYMEPLRQVKRLDIIIIQSQRALVKPDVAAEHRGYDDRCGNQWYRGRAYGLLKAINIEAAPILGDLVPIDGPGLVA